MISRTCLLIGGILNILFGLFHLSFPWLLRWPEQLGNVSSANRALLYTLDSWIILVLLLLGCVSIFHRSDILATALGTTLMLSISGLWLVRAGAEVIFFRLGVDGAWWRLLIFLILAGLYALAFLRKSSARLG